MYTPAYRTLVKSVVFIIVTGFDKTLHMGFFVKIELDVYLIRSTIMGYLPSLRQIACLGASTLCSRLRHTHTEREITVAVHAYGIPVCYM